MEEQNDMEEHLKSSHSISILRNRTKKMLSDMLNPPKYFPTREGLSKNWKGLAELCSVDSYLISNWECCTDPTKDLLNLWQAKDTEATIDQLIIFLQKLYRWDIIEDISPLIADDIKYHEEHPKVNKKQSPLYENYDSPILTGDDLEQINENKELIHYDAFVLFADDDINFAKEVIETMEKQYDVKLCIKDDLTGVLSEHEAMIRLITERCEKLIVILSPSFFNSPVNKFFLNFTQAISLEQRKIIPCLYKPCPMMPPEMRCYFMLNYTKPRIVWNFWDKLYESIKPEKAQANASNRALRRDQPPRQLIIKNHIQPEVNLVPSTSANSLDISITEPEKKTKPKKSNWLKKLLPKNVKHVKRKPVDAS